MGDGADEVRAELDRLEERVDALEERLGIDQPVGVDEEFEPPADEAQRAYVLEWGRWGPPQSGTYHPNPDCRSLHRKDSDRDVVPLPWPIEELQADDEWDVCGWWTRSDAGLDEDADDVQEVDPEDEPDDVQEGPLAGDDSEHKYSTGQEPPRFTDYSRVEEGSDLRGLNVKVPEGVTSQDVYEAVRSGECETINDVCRFVGHPVDGDGRPRGAMRAILHHLGLYDELTAPEANRGRSA